MDALAFHGSFNDLMFACANWIILSTISLWSVLVKSFTLTMPT